MFTLAQAREAIGNSAYFARGGADAARGGVSDVRILDDGGRLTCSGIVSSGGREYTVSFIYDECGERFSDMDCTCGAGGDACRHAAALMVAIAGGIAKVKTEQSGAVFMDALLHGSHSLTRLPGGQEPVCLYPCVRMADARTVMLSLRLGRTRAYVVRSMAELAEHVRGREQVVYGRELIFSHREDELSPADVSLMGQIVMLAEDERYARGGELELTGAALDQVMRLLLDREIEVKGENKETRRVRVVRGDIALPIEIAAENGAAQMQVFAESVVLGGVGAYRFGGETIDCVFGSAFERIAGLLQVASAYPQGIRFEEEQLDEVCTRLIAPARDAAVIRRGREIVAAHTPTPAVPRLYVDTDGGEGLVCRIVLDYCGVELAPGQEYPHIRRNEMLEEEVCAAAKALFPQEKAPGEYAFEGGEQERFALLSQQLLTLEAAGEVMVSERLAKMNVSKRRAMSFSVVRPEKGESLLLRADLGDYTQEDLAKALAAYRQKRKYVRLDSGTFLSGEALEQAAEAAQVLDGLDVTAEQAQAGAEMPASRALYLEEALKGRESIGFKRKKDVSDWIERLIRAQQTSAEQPASLQAQLRSYQLSGLSWLCALGDAGFSGVLADDMGLGKTIQALALLLREKEMDRPVRALVVCPASLQLNWQKEAKKFAPTLRCEALMGSAGERAAKIAGENPPEILITSYDQLRRDVQAYRGIEFSHVLLDEAQNIKNASSLQAKAVKTLRARTRFAMTGTPIENRLSELWSIFDFLMPGYRYTYKKFKERFEAPVVRDADEKARENLHMLVAPFILRRMKKDVLGDLPEKVESVMENEMTAEQKKLYAAHAAQLLKESEGGLLGGQEKIRMLAGLTRLRQLCCDPRLCLEQYTGGSGKLDQLSEIVREAIAGGHHLLIFSQFTSMLDLIAERLSDEGVSFFLLTGDTDKEERMRLVEQFNAGEADVFLISLKAGGTGLNLTGADVVIHYDPWWNVAAQNQATDRAYRIGQTKGVQVIRLIASDTVEERILKMQESKAALSDGVLLGEENLFNMDADALRDILRYVPIR